MIPTDLHKKFIIHNRSYSVVVHTIEEINILKNYLDFDFISYTEKKFPSALSLIDKHCEFVVSCPQEGHLVTYFSEKNGHSIPFWHNFDDIKNEALDLETFINPQENLKEIWKYHARHNKK